MADDRLAAPAVTGAGSASQLLVFNHSSDESGGEIALLEMITAGLASEVHVVFDEPGPISDRLSQNPRVTSHFVSPARSQAAAGLISGVDRRSVARTLERGWAMRTAYRQALRQFPHAEVYANTLRSALVLATVWSGRRRITFHLRDRLAEDFIPRPLLDLVRVVLGVRVSVWVCNSKTTAATVPPTRGSIHVVYSPVNPAFFEVAPKAPSSVTHIVMVGRLTPWKGQLEFVAALRELADRTTPAWTADVVGGALFGEDEYAEQVAAAVSDPIFNGRVRAVGHVTNIVKVMTDADIVVHASVKPEPFGQVVAQGMSAGRAVLASSHGGPAELITHDVDGMLSDPSDATAFARALETLLIDPARRVDLGRRARARCSGLKAEEITGQLAHVLFDQGR